MQTIIDETWATAAPLSVADIRDVKYRLTSVLEAHPRLPDGVGALLNDLVDVIGTLEVERFHLAQGALRADMLRRELEAGGAGDDLLTLLDTLFMEWSLYVRDRAAGQPNPVARLVSLVMQHEDRATRYKAQAKAQAAEIAKLRAQNAQLHEALERAAAPQRMYTYGQSSSAPSERAAAGAVGGGTVRPGAGPSPAPQLGAVARQGPGAERRDPRNVPAGGRHGTGPTRPGERRGAAPGGAGGVSDNGAAAFLQWLLSPVATSGEHAPQSRRAMGKVQ